MGNAHTGNADGQSSLGSYSKHSSFGQAFKAAHAEGGSGHTFTYQNKLYSTNCADGGDYRKKLDTRSDFNHEVRMHGHLANAAFKDATGFDN